MSLWSFPFADTIGEPLVDAWWIPGFTAQQPDYIYAAPSSVTAQGFPSNLNYVTVTGSYFDTRANPLSGYFTFWPSSSLTFNVNNQITYMPQRYSGVSQTLLGINQMATGKIYLWYGQLAVNLLATDNTNMTPSSFTYHVKENYFEGLQYDINVPSSYVNSSVDVHSLIIPGTVRPVDETCYDTASYRLNIPSVSSQWLATEVSTFMLGNPTFNPSQFPVQFAFMTGTAIPQQSDWVPGDWASSAYPYVAQILLGPNGHQLNPGVYQAWIQVTDPPEVPVFPIGLVNIY